MKFEGKFFPWSLATFNGEMYGISTEQIDEYNEKRIYVKDVVYECLHAAKTCETFKIRSVFVTLSCESNLLERIETRGDSLSCESKRRRTEGSNRYLNIVNEQPDLFDAVVRNDEILFTSEQIWTNIII